MKKLIASLVMLSLIGFGFGCGASPTSAPAPKPTKKENGGAKKGKITLSADAITVKQGEKGKVTIKVKREDFDEEITLKFTPPADSKIKVADAKIEKGKSDVEVTLDVDKEAKDGDVKVKVDATGKDVKDTMELSVKVAKKE